jgi:hypothetical protein
MTAMAPEQTAGIAAGRPQPQTTVEPAGGPFIRHTQEGRRLMYSLTGQAYGSVINQPMVASPGYNRSYRILLASTPGTYTSGAYTASSPPAADFPPGVVNLVQCRDAYGTVLFTGPGYEILGLVPLFSGQFGMDDGDALSQNLPSFANNITTTTFGWVWCTSLPFEFAKAMGVISGANASLLPTLQWNFNTLATLYGTVSAASTLSCQVEADFYWLPQGVVVVPPGIGTTCQWIYQPCSPPVSANSATLVQAPRLGGYLTTLIADARDVNSLRQAIWPAAATATAGLPGSRFRLYVDGVPLQDTDMTTLIDDVAIQTGAGGPSAQGSTAVAGSAGARLIDQANSAGASGSFSLQGVMAWSRKTGLSQRAMGLLETGEAFLSTNPGTQIEFAGQPWNASAGGTGPYTISVVAGQVVPSGVLIQGLPEV